MIGCTVGGWFEEMMRSCVQKYKHKNCRRSVCVFVCVLARFLFEVISAVAAAGKGGAEGIANKKPPFHQSEFFFVCQPCHSLMNYCSEVRVVTPL